MNFILGVLSIPGLIKKNPEIKNQRQTLKWYYRTVFGVVIILLLSVIFIPPRSVKFKNEIFPAISLNTIDKTYIPPTRVDKADYIDIRYKTTWFYDCFEPYFDSVNYLLSDYHSSNQDKQNSPIFNDSKDNYIKHKVATRVLNSNINFQPNALYLALASNEIDTVYNNYKGIHLYLINAKKDTLTLPGIDGSISIVQEARDLTGNWRPVEQYPKSWCGNSFYDINLPPNNFIRLTVPRYDGMIRTELRFALAIDAETILYSDSYVGKINPGQFFINGKYLPGNLMDPNY
ncbi:hypothetical protein QQ020_24325 [Fulvivirgaceae bacterium BMA12]|uniref:Uncharacterized protein n=1 Tax=Agaribacillus aureus TaxID=3051825 RepID=A0ABT8LBT4_9BACT|nr:hypothetical protein [Fulvivirgaceae bacterium BMA12]